MKKLIKESKAFIMSDLVAAIIIFSIFTGIIVTLMTKTYKENAEIRFRSNAMCYAITILEKIDEKSYSEITNNPNILLEGMQIDNSVFNINIRITDVPNVNNNAKDIMKIVNISVKYNFLGGTQYLNFSKLKIKETI